MKKMYVVEDEAAERKKALFASAQRLSLRLVRKAPAARRGAENLMEFEVSNYWSSYRKVILIIA